MCIADSTGWVCLQVTIGNSCRVDPFAVALPSLVLPAGAILSPLATKPPAAPRAGAKAAARASEKRSPAWEAAECKVGKPTALLK